MARVQLTTNGIIWNNYVIKETEKEHLNENRIEIE